MKKVILLSIVCLVLTGCIVRHDPGTIYILDNNQPPRPVVTTQSPPPITVVEAQPPLVVVETVPEVFYVSSTPNMFFYSNVWWYCYGGLWYQSSSYRGPWISIELSLIPQHFHRIPERHFQHAGPPPRYDHDNRGPDHGDRGDHQDRGNHGNRQDRDRKDRR
ncbi:MAG: hypothetical protein V1701_11675 [Planctomycetota bacterium]